eukprot:TRINITY_DN13553_c0_g1_i1.p1 TRINITY_DN13553_c0_g1~~TRINITY_DN13553_c0_g1_i1.p1  ORF type:complete len:123 (-),score=15.19 TRINITY_DN13553_c0_g1_i1:67-435(-)
MCYMTEAVCFRGDYNGFFHHGIQCPPPIFDPLTEAVCSNLLEKMSAHCQLRSGAFPAFGEFNERAVDKFPFLRSCDVTFSSSLKFVKVCLDGSIRIARTKQRLHMSVVDAPQNDPKAPWKKR